MFDYMKSLKIIAASSLVATLLPLAALAAKPANQACLGKDFSGYAQTFQPFGQALLGLGVIEGGLGDEVQLHQAGLIPDVVLPNSCNN